jgi:hypothetical protein
MVLSFEFEFEKQYIDRIFFRNYFGFPVYYIDSIPVWSFSKIIIDNCIEEEIMWTVQKPT